MKNEHTKGAHFEPYFGLWRGYDASYLELGETAPIVDRLISEGTVVRQYDLFGDSVVWMPQRVTERQQYKRKRIAELEQELERSIPV